ncbi:MAG: trypsin-like peptidase domain-containing protein [Bdellovibrionales bacterium]
MLKKWILAAVLIAAGTGCSTENSNPEEQIRNTASISPKVIYGNDSRRDWSEVLDQNLLNLADSTVGIMDKATVFISGDTAKLDTYNLGLCENEKFSDQKIGPWCSGFLVAPDIIVTAGHCVESQSHCSNLSFIFGFAKKSHSHDPSKVKASDVYSCDKLVAQKFTDFNADWAVIKLDRPVAGHAPLKVRRSGSISPNTPLTLIGHPSGLPSKIARDGKVYDVRDAYFRADLDSYGGNSGSAVFNAETNEVEGILVRGRTDYQFKNGCKVSNTCEDGVGGKCQVKGNGLDAEHITKISELLRFIPELPKEDPIDEDGDGASSNVFSSNIIVPIPDNPLKKTFSKIKNVSEVSNPQNMKISLTLEHTYISDLSIKLIAPNGNSILLHNRTGRRVVNIDGTYGLSLKSHEDIKTLGPQESGSWTLQIIDHVPYDKGLLMKWGLIL